MNYTEQEQRSEQYLSTGELMDLLGISRSTVTRLRAKGMPHLMVETVYRFPRNQVLSWLTKRGKQRNTESDGAVAISARS